MASVAEVPEISATRAMPLRWRKGLVGELWAEFFGCFILICFGDGVVAMLWALVGSGRSSAGPLQSSGDWLLITWGWALAVCFAVYTVGGVTGVTSIPRLRWHRLYGDSSVKKVPGYWLAQVSGCFVGAARVFLVYNNAINHFDQVNHIVKGRPASVATYSTFATFPAPYFHNVLGPLAEQIVGTFFLAVFVLAVTDEFNLPVGANMAPWIVGMIVMAIGVSFGANAGYAINPARDFGPRIFAWIAGWGKVAMPGDYAHISGYFWVPIVGPLLGGALAAFMYEFGVRGILIARRPPEPGVHGVGETVQGERQS